MKRSALLFIALIMCLSVVACTSTSKNVTTIAETSAAKTPATEAPTEDPVESAKTKLASAVEECYTSKYNFLDYEQFLQTSNDGLSIIVDTDPEFSSYGVFAHEEEAIECIQAINEYLSFPSSVFSKMESTRALDGTQSQSCGDFTATWTYHPDNGLEVIYEVNLH